MGIANHNTGPESCVNDELSVQDISEGLCFDQWNAQLLKQLLPFPHQVDGLLACVNFISLSSSLTQPRQASQPFGRNRR